MAHPARSLAAGVLVVLMALGSVLLWIGVPLFWLWVASRIADSSQPSFSLYALILLAIPATMFVVGKALGWLNRAHMELTGRVDHRRQPTPWLKSMRGERTLRREQGVLAVVMVFSVTLAMLCMAVWFFFFAEGGGLPG